MGLSFSRTTKSDKSIINKSKTTVTRTSVRGGTNLATQVQSIVSVAERKLAHHKDDYILIRTEDELKDYIRAINDNEIAALDTETTGLNPLLIDIVGLCLYTPGQKSAYIPINHISYITNMRTSNQLNERQVSGILKTASCKWIMHNAKYDIRVCRHTLGVDLDCFWDTNLAANCINENESHRLKDLHFKYCNNTTYNNNTTTDTESLTFDSLFNGLTFNYVPISTAYLYAAGDPIKTYQLYEYQKSILNRKMMPGPYRVFMNIEMPVLKVCCDMEDRGLSLDLDFCNKLSAKYNQIKKERVETVNKVLLNYKDKIDTYKMSHPDNKLSDPINISSPTQLAVLFYDILELKSPDKEKPRGTGEEILKEFAKGKEQELCESILSIREVEKLLSTYIDKMPKIAINERVHGSYNQYGAKTGRFSSSDPKIYWAIA